MFSAPESYVEGCAVLGHGDGAFVVYTGMDQGAVAGSPATTFVYALCEPGTGEVRYIGKADDPRSRLMDHLARCDHTHRGRWVRKLKRLGLSPGMTVLQEIPHSGWQDAERYQICLAKMAGVRLTNSTAGGDGFESGPRHPFWGRRHSDRHRANISAAKIGVKRTLTDREIANRARLSEMGRAMLGRPMPLEIRAKISAANRGRHRPQAWSDAILVAIVNKRRRDGGYVGVSRAGDGCNAWTAKITIHGKTFKLGYHRSAADAAITYDWVARLYGRPTNFQV